ncbi:MAG: TIM-barrel domain-containing protein, partial [Spirochaetota bacterium]
VYADGLARGLYLEHPNGLPYEGRVWPGPAVFPDFTSEATRQWWGECHQRLLAAGVDGIWNDMNEPADFDGDPDFRPNFTVPDGLVAEDDGDRRSFGLVHNAYANGMARATRAGLRAGNADRRGFVLTRAGYAGIQRDAAVWTGDNHSWWEHLAVTIPMQLNLGLSGVAFTGADAGGFQLNASPELFARWVGAAALMPFFRAHTAIDTLDHEPWSFGPQVLDAVRELIGLRYRLLPYLYTLFEHAARTGEPIIRPLVWAYPADLRVHDRADSFMLGDDLLVAPVRERGVEERSVYLPEGVWYDYWSGEAWRGGRAVVVEAPLDRVPLFVRAGAIVAHESVRQYTGAAGDGVLRLLVAPGVDSDTGAPSGGGATADAADPGARARGTLYADAGDGYEYRSGAFWRAEFSFADGVLRVATREGSSGHARWHSVAATVLGAGTRSESEPVAIEPGGAEIHV